MLLIYQKNSLLKQKRPVGLFCVAGVFSGIIGL
jgi:hypothetical protein